MLLSVALHHSEFPEMRRTTKISATMKVLIAETDTEFREHLIQRLEESGLEVHGSGNLDESVRLLESTGINLVVLGLSGFGRPSLAFMEEVLGKARETKFVLINRTGNVSLSIEAMKLGAYDEIAVPVDIAVLHNKLLAAAGGPEGHGKQVEKTRI